MSTTPSPSTSKPTFLEWVARQSWTRLSRNLVLGLGFAVVVAGGLADIARFFESRDAEVPVASAMRPAGDVSQVASVAPEVASLASDAAEAAEPASPGVFLDPTIETYTVVSGDVLYQIALRHGTTPQALTVLNSIEDPNRIEVGQVLVLPEPSS